MAVNELSCVSWLVSATILIVLHLSPGQPRQMWHTQLKALTEKKDCLWLDCIAPHNVILDNLQ